MIEQIIRVTKALRTPHFYRPVSWSKIANQTRIKDIYPFWLLICVVWFFQHGVTLNLGMIFSLETLNLVMLLSLESSNTFFHHACLSTLPCLPSDAFAFMLIANSSSDTFACACAFAYANSGSDAFAAIVIKATPTLLVRAHSLVWFDEWSSPNKGNNCGDF